MNKTNKSVILTGVKTIFSNFNADFDGLPRQTSDGIYYASPFALKYAIKKYWEENGEQVFNLKSYNRVEEDGSVKIKPNTLAQRYNSLHPEVTNETSIVEKIQKFYNYIDNKNFGFISTNLETNFGAKGVAQITMGKNLFEDTNTYTDNLLAQYSSGEDKGQTTNGGKSFVDFALYNYVTTVNPKHLDEFKKYSNLEIDYSNVEFNKLLDGLKNGATNLESASKQGCSTSYVLQIDLKDGLPFIGVDYNTLIKVEYNKETSELIIDLSKVTEFINHYSDKIEDAVLYADTFSQKIIGWNGKLESL